VPPLKPELRSFVDWVANYTLSARGMVLRMTLRMGEHLGPERVRHGRAAGRRAAAAHDPARRRVIELLSDRLLARKIRSRARSRCQSAGVIDGLVDEGTLGAEAMPRELHRRRPIRSSP
jgi:primosomal protein N' (replication factor Y)